MKQEEEEIDLHADLSMVTKQALEFDSYMVDEHSNELGDAYMDEEEYSSGDEKLIFWQVAFSKFKRNLTKQLHHTKQMFNKLCTHRSQTVHSHSDFSKYAIVNNSNSVNTSHVVSASPLDADNKIMLQNVHCVNKNANSDQELTTWLLDSGASGHFTPHIEDFVNYKAFPEPIPIQTADKNSKVFILRSGTVILQHYNGLGTIQTTTLSPMYYQPHCTH